ncbi:adenylate/guanylate cyclase domain-containing protein [Gemmobacter denitrificans]|uniref:Adenylate/guanylate cyclase domain-containing protein n=1 Tax=Gemmobacter denitrificans TaxID=3123040 RepID=A0ABU8BTQ5_9RHOB
MTLTDRLLSFVFGPPPVAAVPHSAAEALDRDRTSSELLVCLAQLGAIALFGTFYAFAPKAFPPDVPFEPVPVALGFYTIFTLIRLVMVLRGYLPNWLLGLSVVVDISLLMLTIWSFHLQYQSPPTVYLKAPTLLYAFILIALRMLRAEPGWILFAGGCTLVGWTALVGYAVMMTDKMNVTRDFAVWATSDALLLGAEIDRAMAFTIFTAILAVAAVRSRRLLVRAVTEAHAAAELSRFFAPEIATGIRETINSLKPGDATLREAGVMMVDLRGFTRLSEGLPAEAVLGLIEEYQACVVPAIRQAGGSIDKYLGDGILATFGAARESATFAADALRAQMAVQAAAAAWSADRLSRGLTPVAVGTAVATGQMLCGVVGVEDRLEWTVIGDPVNLAAKLEKHCKTRGVAALATREALELSRHQGFDPEGAQVFSHEIVEGVGHPVDLVALPPPAPIQEGPSR